MNDKNILTTTINDDLEPQLEAAVWAVLSEPLPADAIERVKSKARTLESEQVQVARPTPLAATSNRRWIQIAFLAACLMLVVGVTTMLSSTSNAFAQVVERIKTAGSFRYKEFVYLTSQEKPVEVEVLVSDDGRERRSMLNTVTVSDASGLPRLSLNEPAKTATVHELVSIGHEDGQRQIKWFELLRSYGNKPDKELGKMNVDGRDCIGFEVKLAQAVYAVWVDAKTSDLVQVEFTGMPKGSSVTKSVMKDFEFNVTLDPMLFSFDAPQGYQSSTAAKLPELLPFEESLVEALKGYTELSGGKFPRSITDQAEWMTILSKDGIPRITLAARLGTLTPYLTGMSHDDYDYTGAGKAVDGTRAIVFWYRNPEKQLRAVYSDFTVATITEADLPRN